MADGTIVLKFKGPVYYSHQDEESFFAWLGNIPSVKHISGELEDVHIVVDLKEMNDGQLQDLIALHKRYRLPMRHLTALETPEKLNAANKGD